MTRTSISPIETQYKGYRFRSRLEARWAVAFDTLGIPWEYETEGFPLPSGRGYLPDFWLPTVNDGCWIEVKPFLPGAACFVTDPKVKEFAASLPEGLGMQQQESTIYQLNGLPPTQITSSYGHSDCVNCSGVYVLSWPYDNCQDWCICPLTGKVGIQYESRANRITPCKSPKEYEGRGDRGHNADHPRLLEAWTAARSARFEHGECG